MALAQSTSQLMPLYDLLLMRLEPLPLTVASLNALLLTAVFSRIPLLALGPTAFWRFFHTVHGRIAAPATAYDRGHYPSYCMLPEITIEVDHALANRSTRLSRTRNAVYQTR